MNDLDKLRGNLGLDPPTDNEADNHPLSALWEGMTAKTKKPRKNSKQWAGNLLNLRDAFNKVDGITAATCYSGSLSDWLLITRDRETAITAMAEGCPFVVYTLPELAYIESMGRGNIAFAKEVHRIKQHFPCYVEGFSIEPAHVLKNEAHTEIH